MAKRRSFKKNKKQIKKLISLVISAVILVAALIGYLTGCFDSILANLGSDGGDGREPTTVTGEMQVHFLDVGQGDCILVRSGEKCMLVDTGDKNDTYNEKIVDSINYFYEAGYFDSDDVQEVLAKVPSYQELMSLKRKAKFLK